MKEREQLLVNRALVRRLGPIRTHDRSNELERYLLIRRREPTKQRDRANLELGIDVLRVVTRDDLRCDRRDLGVELRVLGLDALRRSGRERDELILVLPDQRFFAFVQPAVDVAD